jgi:protein-S-isoprenylcysteine O-methyltransferase Ste14
VSKAIVSTVLYYSIASVLYFVAAGRWDLPLAWLYFIVNAAVGFGLVLVLGRKDPGLLQERLKPGPGEKDRIFKAVNTTLMAIQFVIAGFDAGRRHWAPGVSPALQVTSLLLVFGGLLMLTWAMLANPFFSSAVRLQPDRKQVLVSTGPYRLVRHPGYTGGILYLIFTGLALGSWWAESLAIPMLILTLRRTRMEDSMLRDGLEGYGDYSAKVRFRLIPGVW